MNPAEAKPMYCPNCQEEIIENDLTAKGCVFCSSTCDWCGEHDLNEDTHFVNCLVRKPSTDQLKASILLYDLCKSLANMIDYKNFNDVRSQWNKAMNAHEQAIKKSTEIYEPRLFCEDCYGSELKEGNIKESILDQFESLKPE